MLPLIFLGLVAATQVSPATGDCGRVVCYHTNWSQYRPGSGKFFPDNIDPNLCTHLVYAFAKLTGNHLAPFEWNDDSTDWSVGLYEKFQNLKQTNPSLKTLLAVGGWNLGSAPFHAIASSPSNRAEFVKQSIEFLRKRGFDGPDLDWEYPANRGSPPEDKQNFVSLVKDLRAGFEAEAQSSGNERLLLTAAVAAGKDTIDTAYDVPVLTKELDYISLMSYDLHGSWEKTAGHNSPLYARPDETGDDRHLNIDWAAQYWVSKGVDKSKFNVGMGLYGRDFTLASAANSDLGDAAPAAGPAGQFTREKGFIAYYEICDMIKQGAAVEWDDDSYVPYIHKDTVWVGYDNPKSLREKVRYVKDNNFGGVMVWALPLDDFSGSHCGDGPFPLMHAINDECGQSTGSLVTAAPAQQTTRATQGSHTQGHTNPAQQNTTPQPHHNIESSNKFTCPGQDGFYPSEHCDHYYICAGGSSYAVKCADGLVFNPNSGFCDWPEHYTCTLDGQVPTSGPAHTQPPHTNAPWTQPPHTNPPHTQPPQTSAPWSGGANTQAPSTQAPWTPPPQTQAPWTPPPQTQAPWTQAPPASQDVSRFCESNSDGIHADPSDCAYFIQCAGGITFREPCSPGTAFNINIKTCDILQNAHCDHSA